MKKSIVAIIAILVLAFGTFAFASDHGKSDHSGHGHDMKGEHASHGMDHAGHEGDMIRESEIDGYKFTYHLIDMMEKMKGMKNMPEMKATHHLMVYVKSPKGDVTKAKVGYLVTNPDGTNQKAMCMGMKGGFGADVDLKAKGMYKIKTKVVDGDKKLMDEFEYHVK